jgi:hypothetical protein
MEIKTSHLIVGAVAVIALMNGENVRSSIHKGNDIRTEQSQFNDRIRRNRTEARNAEKLSKIALTRYRNNCILVVDEQTGKESYFQPGTSVVDKQLGRPLRAGVPICNKLGDTGIVSEAGTITDIARVSIPDQPTFKQFLAQRR